MKKLLIGIIAILPVMGFGQNLKHITVDSVTIFCDSTAISAVDSLDHIKITETPFNYDSVEVRFEKKKVVYDEKYYRISENYPPQGITYPNLIIPKPKFLSGINKTRTGIGFGLMFVSGVAAGYKEVILHHYPQFKRVHPYADDSYFNPDESWLRKYKNGDPTQGEAFWQSKGFLVPFTDFYHLTGVVDHGMLLSGTVMITIGEKRKWYEYVIPILGGMAVRAAGFHLIYDVIYK